jgi:peptidoglycan/LPS O-acetylase OafA/YrhL
MRVYGASLLTVGVMQCTPIRMLLSHQRLRVLGRLSFPIYLTHWPIVFGLGGFTVVALTPLAGPMRARIAALLISIFVTVFLAAAFFEPIDQIALRVSRAWRKRKVVEA